jgi:uncharacterized protein (TIGR02466 family)
MRPSEIYPLFPTVVYKNKLERKLTSEELNFIYSSEVFHQSLGNEISTNNWILENSILTQLKNDLMEHVNIYLNEIMMVEAELYITNSWINVTGYQKQHALHNHNNSIISGVFYVDAADSQPSITFNKMNPPFFLHMKAKDYTIFNSMEWNIPIENNTIIVFPSQCYHFVKPNLTENQRISIAFNTFVRGNIGGDAEGADLNLR